MSSQKLSGLHELRHGPQKRWTAGTARTLGDVGSKEPQECRTAKTARGIVYIYIYRLQQPQERRPASADCEMEGLESSIE